MTFGTLGSLRILLRSLEYSPVSDSTMLDSAHRHLSPTQAPSGPSDIHMLQCSLLGYRPYNFPLTKEVSRPFRDTSLTTKCLLSSVLLELSCIQILHYGKNARFHTGRQTDTEYHVTELISVANSNISEFES